MWPRAMGSVHFIFWWHLIPDSRGPGVSLPSPMAHHQATLSPANQALEQGQSQVRVSRARTIRCTFC